MKLLQGIVEEAADPRITELEADVRQMRRELADAKVEAQRVREDAGRALSRLRQQLSPLYRALQAVFGELDAAGVESDPAGPSASAPGPIDARAAAIWASWKGRLGPQCGKVIEALLLQPDMNTTQLAIAIGTRRQNIPGLIYKLNQAGLLNKNGGRFALKPL